MRTHLYSALATLKIGLDILQQEQVQVDKMYGHGGFFTTKGVGQRITAAAMNAPVSVMETAGEGGAWGIALLADFMVHKQEGQSLAQYLEDYVFAGNEGTTIAPDPEIVHLMAQIPSYLLYILLMQEHLLLYQEVFRLHQIPLSHIFPYYFLFLVIFI